MAVSADTHDVLSQLERIDARLQELRALIAIDWLADELDIDQEKQLARIDQIRRILELVTADVWHDGNER